MFLHMFYLLKSAYNFTGMYHYFLWFIIMLILPISQEATSIKGKIETDKS